MENRNEVYDFKKRSVHVICWAGSDRSKYISDELTRRGYNSTHGGVMDSQNYVTKEDLNFVGSIIFSSLAEKERFDQDKNLKSFVKKNKIQLFIMNITESRKNYAHNNKEINSLIEEISSQLDRIGFKKTEANN